MASTLLLIIAFFTGFVDASRKYKYESSYAFLDVQNGNGQFCVNFQQWRSRDLPALAADSTPKTLKWWIAPNGTDICKERKGAGIFAENVIIPAEYVTKMIELKECIGRVGFNESEPMRMKAVGNEVAVMKAQGVRNILFLVEKGKPNGYRMRDYLFTHFYNSEIDDSDESMNIFYIYEHVFKQQIQPNIVNDQHFRFYQPQSSLPMDPAVAVLWLFAFSSILIGSIWAAAETRAKIAIRLEEEGSQTELTQEEGEAATAETNNNPPRTTNKNAMKRSESTEIAQMSGCQHCISVGIALVVVVSVLMLAFFFRDYAVHVFNVFLVILGIFAIQSCLLALLRLVIGESDFQIGTLRQLFCGKCRKTAQEGDQLEGQPPPSTGSSHHKPSRLDRPIFLFPFLLYIVSASICIFWYAIRNHAYAFLLLDPINLAICIYSIRASRIRSLRLITFLLLAMFVYDIFMVFGTRLLTQDGCSVMIQVVTGMDCRSTSTAESMGKQFQPIAPIDAVMPEKLPLLFYMPMLADPMGICYDLEVEREFKHVMLGLGDVILPGYLIAFCFYMDVVEKNRFHTYGLISMIGYSLGMACTFIALLIMETAQPALIYLVPFTLIPVYAWAIFGDEKGTLGKMWRGEM